MITLCYIQDSQHGWVSVPAAFLRRYDLVDDISAFSYISDDYINVWLEEDCDAPKLIRKLMQLGLKFVVVDRLVDGEWQGKYEHLSYDPSYLTNPYRVADTCQKESQV